MFNNLDKRTIPNIRLTPISQGPFYGTLANSAESDHIKQLLIKFCTCFQNILLKLRKVAKIRNWYNQVPHLTQDTTWESDKNTIKHHKRETRGHSFPSRWPQGSNEQTRKHEKHKTEITQMIHKRSTALKRSVKYFTGGLKLVSLC